MVCTNVYSQVLHGAGDVFVVLRNISLGGLVQTSGLCCVYADLHSIAYFSSRLYVVYIYVQYILLL